MTSLLRALPPKIGPELSNTLLIWSSIPARGSITLRICLPGFKLTFQSGDAIAGMKYVVLYRREHAPQNAQLHLVQPHTVVEAAQTRNRLTRVIRHQETQVGQSFF